MASGDLTSLADVKAWLSTGGPGSPLPSFDDALLARLITAASQAIISWLGRPLLAADWIEVRDGLSGPFGPRAARFAFAVTPASAVGLVVVDGLTIPPIPPPAPAPPGQGAVSPYPSQAGYVFSATELVIRGYYVPRKAQCVTIQYTAGYASVPADVAQACIEWVALRYRARTRIGELSRRIGQEVVAYDHSDLPASLKMLLQPYRMVAPIAGAMPQLAPGSAGAVMPAGAAT